MDPVTLVAIAAIAANTIVAAANIIVAIITTRTGDPGLKRKLAKTTDAAETRDAMKIFCRDRCPVRSQRGFHNLEQEARK